jgi:hypothetical protein
LVNEQFGFREKLSTEMATYTLLDNILSSLNKKNYVGGLVTCKRLSILLIIIVAKMEFCGISGIVNKLMKSYVEN